MYVQVISPISRFFLHSLEVDEEDFQDLKHDQSILVDFSKFPQSLIEILEHYCAGAYPDLAVEGGAVPKFQAALSVREKGESAVRIMETNGFKHLCQIPQSFRPGTDTMVKGYFAQRLLEAHAAPQSTGHGRTSAESQLEPSRTYAAVMQNRLAQEQPDLRKLLAEADSQLKSALAEQSDKFMGDLEEARSRQEGNKAAAEACASERAATADTRAERLSKWNTPQEDKCVLEARRVELTAKLSSAEEELGALREEAEGLRKANSKLSKEKLEAENQLQELLIRSSASGVQIQEMERQYKEMEKRVDAAQKASSALASALKEVKAGALRAEEWAQASAQEVCKANGVIELLQADLRGAKATSKLKASAIQQQEVLLQEKQAAAEKVAQQAHENGGDLERKRAENSHGKIKYYQHKMPESKEALKKNQNMT